MKPCLPSFAILAAVALLLAACSPNVPVQAAATAAPDTAATVMVTRADVVGVLTLTGIVSQGAGFQIHTSIAGAVTSVTGEAITIAPEDGAPDVVVTAADGTRMEQPLVMEGDRTVPGMALAQAPATGFTVTVVLDPAALLRFVTPPLGARAQVKGGSGPFECPLVDPVPSNPAATGDGDGETQLLCAVPQEATVLAGMEATVVIQLERVDDALVLPVEAVAGTVDAGSVYIVGADGAPVETPVELGTTDGARVVIVSGLDKGDEVYVPGPWLGQSDG